MLLISLQRDVQNLTRREIEAFVKSAVVDRPVAEECHRHAIRLEQFETVPGAGGLQDARADDASRHDDEVMIEAFVPGFFGW